MRSIETGAAYTIGSKCVTTYIFRARWFKRQTNTIHTPSYTIFKHIEAFNLLHSLYNSVEWGNAMHAFHKCARVTIQRLLSHKHTGQPLSQTSLPPTTPPHQSFTQGIAGRLCFGKQRPGTRAHIKYGDQFYVIAAQQHTAWCTLFVYYRRKVYSYMFEYAVQRGFL